jgi:hypothetical protein
VGDNGTVIGLGFLVLGLFAWKQRRSIKPTV